MKPLGVIVMLAGLLLAAGVLVAAGYWRGWDLPAEPDIHTDYAAQLNAEALATPEEDQAWPLYAEAAVRLTPEASQDAWEVNNGNPEAGESLRALLHEDPRVLDLLREAGEKPSLGVVLTNENDPEYVRLSNEIDGYNAEIPEPDPDAPLFRIILPHARVLDSLASVLLADIALAAARSEYATVIERLEMLAAIVQHLDRTPYSTNIATRVQQKTGKAVRAAVAPTLASWPDESLDSLDRVLVADGYQPLASNYFADETIMLLDAVQRVYAANGKPSRAGLRLLSHPYPSMRYEPENEVTVADGRLMASRDEVLEAIGTIERLRLADRDLPLREHFASEAEAYIRDLLGDIAGRDRYRVLDSFITRAGGLHYLEAETFAALELGSARVTVALERYRRDQGSLPEALAELVPAYIDALPTDPADGEPIRYRRSADGYVLYALGVDGDDDGGVPPAEPDIGPRGAKHEDWLGRAALERHLADEPEAYDGDWILYPRQVNTAPDETE